MVILQLLAMRHDFVIKLSIFVYHALFQTDVVPMTYAIVVLVKTVAVPTIVIFKINIVHFLVSLLRT